VVIAVVSMRVVQAALHQVIQVVSMGNLLMSAFGAVHMPGVMAFRPVGTGSGIGLVQLNDVFVHVISVDVVQMPVV
jgi:hypothetical protein